MAEYFNGQAWTFTLSPRRAEQIAKRFAGIYRPPHPDLTAVMVVEQAVERFLDRRDAAKQSPNPALVEAHARNQARVKDIAALSANLLRRLEEYIATPDDTVADCQFETLPGLLALERRAQLRAATDRSGTASPSPSLNELAIDAWGETFDAVAALARASTEWLNREARDPHEKPRGELNDLVMELSGAVYSLLMSDQAKLESWQRKPAAPGGPLCYLTEIVFEERGLKCPNFPQLVRRALEYDRRWTEGMNDYVDGWLEKYEQNDPFATGPFCSEGVDAKA